MFGQLPLLKKKLLWMAALHRLINREMQAKRGTAHIDKGSVISAARLAVSSVSHGVSRHSRRLPFCYLEIETPPSISNAVGMTIGDPHNLKIQPKVRLSRGSPSPVAPGVVARARETTPVWGGELCWTPGIQEVAGVSSSVPCVRPDCTLLQRLLDETRHQNSAYSRINCSM